MTGRIAVVGTGLMGTAVARQFALHGAQVTVWNRTRERAEPLAAHGIAVAATLSEALRAADLVYLQLLDYGSARALLVAVEDDALQGKVVVAGMTGTSGDARDFGAAVTSRGATYLDACLELYPENIGSAEGIINYAGDAQAWSRWREPLTVLAGGSTFLGEDPALASFADAAIAGAFFNSALGGFLEAASFAEGVGLTVTQLRPFVATVLELLKHQILDKAIPAIESGDYSTDQATLEVYLHAVRIWRNELIAAGERGAVMTANQHNLEVALAAGYGSGSIFSQYLTARVNARDPQPTA